MFKNKEKYEVMDFVKIDIMCETMKQMVAITRILNDQDSGSKMVNYNLESMEKNIEWLQNYNQELKERL